MKKLFLILPLVSIILFSPGCKQEAELDEEHDPDAKPAVTNPDTTTDDEIPEDPEDPFAVVVSNSDYGESRAKNLDYIFNNEKLGTTTVTLTRSEWNKLCDNYRYFYKNENNVKAVSYSYSKGDRSWTLKDVGFRLRGNTSRFCPQGYDNGNIQSFANQNLSGQMNKDWSKDYYSYANNQPLRGGDYRQSHFKVDFEGFIPDGEEQKMAGCMKGVALKRLDNICGKEIFCYDLFRKNGIWTAPRASHTRVFIKIIEDDNTVTTVDYGVYEMFEEVNKQSLKARASYNNENKASNAWKNGKGDLWKCCNDLTTKEMGGMGVEDIRIIFAGESKSNMQKNGREDSSRIGYVWNQYSLDLKTNKNDFSAASTRFSTFITELNALPKEAENDESISTIKNFYNKWFDMDLFLKTYAINILCGMDDDYWGNKNNYYLYFDNDATGSGKVYFIPFDYDNTLGSSINGDKEGFKHNPLEWGRGANRPLIDRLLLVPEFKEKFENYLLEVCSNQYWNFTRCSGVLNKWGNMCDTYMRNAKVDYHIGADCFADWGTWNPEGYFLLTEPSVFTATKDYFNYWIKGTEIPNILSVDSSASDPGIFIKIDTTQIPNDAAIRKFYINGSQVADVGFSKDDKTGIITIPPAVKAGDWAYPFVEANGKYKVKVEYQNTSYKTIYTSPELLVTAESGRGELSVTPHPDFSISSMIVDNKLNYEPTMKLGDNPLALSQVGEWELYYVIEVNTTDWKWQSWNHCYPTCNGFDFSGKIDGKDEYVVKDRTSDLMFTLYFVIPNETYGSYRYIIYTNDDTKGFRLK